MDNTEQFGISLCSGYCGIERGLELAGVEFRTIAYVEIEAFAIANLVAKMEQGLLVPAPVWTNLKTFPVEKFRGRVDFITAGYPCQPFSCAGQRKGKEDPRHLWPYVRRIYRAIRPRWMFFENVEGHVTLGLSTVISDLEEDGYEVEAGLFTAAEVGAPHRRKRVFILAHSMRYGRRRWSESRGEVREREMPEDKIEGSSTPFEVLGNAPSAGFSWNGESEQHHNLQNVERGSGQRREKLANPNQPGSQGRNSGELSERSVKWPARPGSPQYGWEEPRVVESQMGRAVNGASRRVDELRLLGNGVVPQQAARAYLILMSRMLMNEPTS